MSARIVVVDTNVLSCVYRKKPLGAVYSEILKDYSIIIVPFQVVAELEFWATNNSWGKDRYDHIISEVSRHNIVYATRSTCALWARIRAPRTKNGNPLLSADAWIAAIALELDAPLMTHDVSDFQNIPDLRIITAATK